MALMMSALGALALTSGIALTASQPLDMGDHPPGDLSPAPAAEMMARQDRVDTNKDARISAAEHEQARAAMRGHVERA